MWYCFDDAYDEAFLYVRKGIITLLYSRECCDSAGDSGPHLQSCMQSILTVQCVRKSKTWTGKKTHRSRYIKTFFDIGKTLNFRRREEKN
jgi:hypothetical protein